MKKTNPGRKPRGQYPVPDWMSPDVAIKAKTMDPIARVELAEQLERAAAELREFKPPAIKAVAIAHVRLKPMAKEAILFYADMSGAAKESSEQESWISELGGS